MQTQSIGARLKSAREKTKLSLEDIATQGRLSISRLIALENNQVSASELTAFDQSYLKKYCQITGVVYDDLFHDLKVKKLNTQSLTYETTARSRHRIKQPLLIKPLLISALLGFVAYMGIALVRHPVSTSQFVNSQVLLDNSTIEQI